MKKIFTFAIALVCALAVNAQTVTLSGAEKALEPAVLTAGSTATVYVYVTGVANQTAFEANLFLPEGVKITKKANANLTKDEDGEATHSVSFADQGADGWKILIYSTDLTKFSGDAGSIAKLTIQAPAEFVGGEAYFKGVIFADPASVKTEIAQTENIPVAEATGINDVKAEINSNAPIYNLQGVQVKSAEKGVFIQNGKKYIVK